MEDPFGLNAAREKRRTHDLTVSIDPGSSEYLFYASYEQISQTFRKRFPDVNCEKQRDLHSPMAGTTIDIVVMGLSAGAGLIAAEVVKGMGKDLWQAIKDCIKRRRWFSRKNASGADSLSLTVMLAETELRLSLNNIGSDSVPNIQKMLTIGLEKLVDLRRELQEQNGFASTPSMRVPPGTRRIELDFHGDNLVLRSPLCLSCEHLLSEYISSPCLSCWRYSEKPGKHAGRPTVSLEAIGKGVTYDDFGQAIPDQYLVEYSARIDNFVFRQVANTSAK